MARALALTKRRLPVLPSGEGRNLREPVLYNVIALPVAAVGLVNPFIAAAAMSLSSVVVVLNALRLGMNGRSHAIAKHAYRAGVREVS